jgi:outer membrane protein assembly factor BamB
MLAGLVLLAVGFSGCDWTMVGFDAANTYSTPDTSLNSDNVPDLVPVFSGSSGGETGPPVVANGVLYDESYASSSQTMSLEAFDATGTSCATQCRPLWSAPLASTTTSLFSSPAVANGVVYAGSSDNLEAFDAAGHTNCSGTPKTCSPLWSALVGPIGNSSPVVAKGVVYFGSTDDNLYAFDASGVTDCSGTPKTCSPLWSAATGGAIEASPSVANGVVYVGSADNNLYAFDASGVTNCSGAAKTCSPLWSATLSAPVINSAAVANGIVYVGTNGATESPDNLYAFDAAGATDCSGTPKTCSPLWRYDVLSQAVGPPAVADGHVYVGIGSHIFGDFGAFDASGTTNCSGTPKVCEPLWTIGFSGSGVAVGNGLVYVSTVGGARVYNESGQQLYGPLFPLNIAGAVIANGMIYSDSFTGFDAFAPLRTQVLVPPNSSSLSGTTVLDASAPVDNALTLRVLPTVQFVVSGGSLSDQVVGTAALTLYGWVAQWDTTTVPNGTYTLQSEASGLTPSAVMSPGVTITVSN